MIIHRHHISEAGAEPAELITPAVAKPLDAMAEIYLALVMGLRDSATRTGSNGSISDCPAVSTQRWLPHWRATRWALIMSMAFPIPVPTLRAPKSDAADLAARTGLHFMTVPIAPAVDAFHQMLDLDGVAAENLRPGFEP
jgi:NAD+ synthase (glutamine-hydrolysing)